MPEREEHSRRPPGTTNGQEARRPNPRILEEVLQQTDLLLASEGSDVSEDVESLKSVAREHSGADVDSVLPHLVRAMLGRVFGRSVDQSWEPMTQMITESLREDPKARLRVETLWARLLAATSE